MAKVDIPAPQHLGQGDLARATIHGPDTRWPERVVIRCTWPDGKFSEYEITSEAFFGNYSAPLAGNELISAIDRMRKNKPE
jgi:hypothetical protein